MVAFGSALCVWALWLGRANAKLEDDDLGREFTEEQLRTLHSKFDEDGNGKVSLDEILAHSLEVSAAVAHKDIESILDEVDSNSDGVVSLQEHLSDINAGSQDADEAEVEDLKTEKKTESAKFRAADTNRDGFLNSQELPGLIFPETHDGVLAVAVAEVMRQKDSDDDGALSAKEFFDIDDEDDESDLTDEEAADFRKLDVDGDGSVNLEELSNWESGRFHTEEAMRWLFTTADSDGDSHMSAEEFIAVKAKVVNTDVQYHLREWADHHEL